MASKIYRLGSVMISELRKIPSHVSREFAFDIISKAFFCNGDVNSRKPVFGTRQTMYTNDS